MATQRTFPKKAEVTVIGIGGGAGAFAAWHLARMGMRNIVGVEMGAIPTDTGSSSHTSGFNFMTAHDKLTVWSTVYGRKIYESMGNYIKCGGFEICLEGDEERWEELKRKVASGKSYGTNVSLVTPREVKEKCPHINTDILRGAMWDPDCGLVTPRFTDVISKVLNEAEQMGALQKFADTPVTEIDVKKGRVRGVRTPRGFIESPIVIIAAGMWSPLLAEMAGASCPLAVGEHPLLFFPSKEMEALWASGIQIASPIVRHQSIMTYERQERQFRELGIYPFDPIIFHPAEIPKVGQAKSLSTREPDYPRLMAQWEEMIKVCPEFGELGIDYAESIGGLLSYPPDNGSLIGESPEAKGFFFKSAIWEKDIPGTTLLGAENVKYGASKTMDFHGADISRFYPVQKEWRYVWARAKETASKIYGIVHPREPYLSGRNIFHSPFYRREQELGGHFMELAAWERAHAYEANRKRLGKYLKRVPKVENEWDARHVPYDLAYAETLAMAEHVGMINLSHFAIFDIEGPDAKALLDYLAVANMDVVHGRAVYTNFLDYWGGVRSDLTITRRLSENKYRVVTGGADGNRDYVWIKNHRDDKGFDAEITDRTHDIATLGFWGPNARKILSKFIEDPEELSSDKFGFGTAKNLVLKIPAPEWPDIKIDTDVWALRISYVGEFGWELYFENDTAIGTRLWDAFFKAGVIPVGIEAYAKIRRMEKCFRLQGTDLETEYNAWESGVGRPRTKKADFLGKKAYLAQKDEEPAAKLCILTMNDNASSNGTPRYPVGNNWPILDAKTKEVLIDSKGRRSYMRDGSYGPSVGKFILESYIPAEHIEVGRRFLLEYFGEHYPLTLEIAGYGSLYDPNNERVK